MPLPVPWLWMFKCAQCPQILSCKVPKTAENFCCLVTGERGKGKSSGKPLHYKVLLWGRYLSSGDMQKLAQHLPACRVASSIELSLGLWHKAATLSKVGLLTLAVKVVRP